MYTEEELQEMSRSELIQLVMELQDEVTELIEELETDHRN